jgi:methyl-accepting chemotaxis protein
MSLPPAYRVGLGLYEIDAETLGLRREIWEILGPELGAIVNRHVGLVAAYTKFYADTLTADRKPYADLIRETTGRSVQEIGGTERAINAITEIAARVADAVNEQVAATDGIAGGASKAAVNTATVAEVLRTVEEAIRQTQTTAASVLSFSKSLSETAGEMDAAMTTLFAAASQHRGVEIFSDLSSVAR